MPEFKHHNPNQHPTPNRKRPGCMPILIGLVLLVAGVVILAFCIRRNSHSFGNIPQQDDHLMTDDLTMLSGRTYDGALLSMHAPEAFSEMDFAMYLGQNIAVTSHSILDTRELSSYLDCIFNSGNPISSMYLCLDPELLWVNVDESTLKWKKRLNDDLYAYIEDHPGTDFKILLPYPYIDYWLDLTEQNLDTLLTLYHTLVNELSVYPNTKIFFPGFEKWLMVNPANYTDTLFDANEIITNKIFLYTFCDSAYQITPVNEDFFWNSIRETVAEEKASPTVYPDLSEWCLVFFGDSVLGNFPGTFSIPGYVSGLSGAACYNYAVGGTSASYRGGNQDFPNTVGSFFDKNVTTTESGRLFTPNGTQVDGLSDKKLCFIINYGFNDYFSGSPVDNPENAYDILSYKGGLRTCITTLQASFPDACYILVSPTHTALFGNGTEITSDVGDVLPAYIEAARELADEMGLYFLDNYHESAITEENLDEYLSDGCHPNERGRLTLAIELMDYIAENVRQSPPQRTPHAPLP